MGELSSWASGYWRCFRGSPGGLYNIFQNLKSFPITLCPSMIVHDMSTFSARFNMNTFLAAVGAFLSCCSLVANRTGFRDNWWVPSRLQARGVAIHNCQNEINACFDILFGFISNSLMIEEWTEEPQGAMIAWWLSTACSTSPVQSVIIMVHCSGVVTPYITCLLLFVNIVSYELEAYPLIYPLL